MVLILQVRTGMLTVSDGKSKPVPMQLHLSMEVLKLQREDLEVKLLPSILMEYGHEWISEWKI